MAMIVGSTKRPHNKPPMIEQKKKPVLLTNGTCDNCKSFTQQDFAILGLQAGDQAGEWYPLTEYENLYIGEDTAAPKMKSGGALMGYACVYKGKKWLCPCIEVCYWPSQPPRPFSKGSYGGTLFKDRNLSVVHCHWLVEQLTPRLKAVGGHLFVDYDEPSECAAGSFSDRHSIWLVLPFDLAHGIAPPYKGDFREQPGCPFLQWKAYLTGFLAGV